MSILDRIEVVHGDILDIEADLLVMKHADGFYGADLAVARALALNGGPENGEVEFHPGRFPVRAREVAFLGVGVLYDFRYQEIFEFGQDLLRIATEERPDSAVIATTIHGPGYGLDETVSFLAELRGMLESRHSEDATAARIVFVEMSERRAYRLRRILANLRNDLAEDLAAEAAVETAPAEIEAEAQMFAGGRPDDDPRMLFVAMPFADKYEDEYHIGFTEAAHPNNYICECLKYEKYTGDVVREIERRIRSAKGIIALLNDRNPNVFLEIGYAMALSKPLILVAKEGEPIPFDIRNLRRITYSGIRELRTLMTDEIRELSAQGVL